MFKLLKKRDDQTASYSMNSSEKKESDAEKKEDAAE
jgi:hypothetical protein